MALEVSFSFEEQNDNKVVTFTDDKGTYDAGSNPNGWGAPNTAPADIVDAGGIHTLSLDITITEPDGTATVYDQIDLHAEFGSFTDTGDLVYPIDATYLLVSSVALGVATDELPDGVWDVIYTLDEGLGGEDIHTEKILIYGKVKVKVYDILRDIPVTYACETCDRADEISEADFAGAYLAGIEATNASETILTAKQEEILDMLEVLEDIVVNESNIIW